MKLHGWNSFLLLGMILNIATAKESCIDGKIRYTQGTKRIETAASYCLVTDSKHKDKFLVSKKCKDLKCAPPRKPLIIESFYSEYGTPAFKVCHELGGRGQVIQYWNNKWIDSDRCIFDQDNYIETTYLYVLWEDIIIKK